MWVNGDGKELINFTLQQAIKAQKGGRGVSLLFLSPQRKVGVGVLRHAPGNNPVSIV